jgi:hypothetical protein
MRILSLAAFLLAATAPLVPATVINITTDPAAGRIAVDAQLNPLDNGDLFLVGTFSNPGAISLSLGSMANMMAAGGWSQFGSNRAIQTIGASGGRVTGPSSDTTPAAAAFNNQPLYLIIFNTSSPNSPQAGIFRATAAAGSNAWTFPVYDPAGITDGRTITVDDPSVTAIGGVGLATNTPSRFVLATLVPEPSAFVLLAPGIVGLLGYRRLRGRR